MSNKTINMKSFKSKKLKMISINVNSLVANQRRFNLKHFINKHKIDIALINETKLKNVRKVNFENYSIFRDDRIEGRGGGTAIVIKKIFHVKKST